MKTKPSQAKQRIIESTPYIINKKLRSKRPRRIRSQISPVLKNRVGGIEIVSVLSIDSSSCTYFNNEEVSCDSSVVSVQSNLKKRKKSNKRQLSEIENAPFRRITRSYHKQLENQSKGNDQVEVSESSCVESNSGAAFGERSSKLKRSENAKEIEEEENEVSAISCKIQVPENTKIDIVSFTSGVDSCSVAKSEGNFAKSENRAPSLKFKNDFATDLACAEQLSTCYDDVSEYSSGHETVFSELQYSDFNFSDYSPSSFFDSSGSEFSEKSIGSSPSHTYALLLEFREQFSRSTASHKDTRNASHMEEEEDYDDLSKLMRFRNDEEEECYKMLRSRERRQVFVYDYAEEYRTTTEYGDLVVQQRSQMVHWIVEHCKAKENQLETLFLAVGLLDRFLSKGYFRNKRNLQILGVACLTLATRIEENQPYNSVRQKNFYIGSNTYTRCEVVAMEWLVQEVLNFQCFLPTIYNFLWLYLKAARADAEIEKRVKYLAVLVLSDQEHLCYWPSTVAASLVILASLEKAQDISYQRVIKIHVRTKHNDLPDCIKNLDWLLQYIN